MSRGRTRLLELEKTEGFVFHGTGEEIEEFEPRQAFNYHDGVEEPDGPPAVFASSSADYAILMAIINKKNCPKGFRSGAGTMDGALAFRATNATLDQLTSQSSGWVYVFDKKAFAQRDTGGVEYISLARATPREKVLVSKADLPPVMVIPKGA